MRTVADIIYVRTVADILYEKTVADILYVRTVADIIRDMRTVSDIILENRSRYYSHTRNPYQIFSTKPVSDSTRTIPLMSLAALILSFPEYLTKIHSGVVSH